MLSWLRNRRKRAERRHQAERLAQADAEALVRDHGGEAYSECSPARGKRVGVDTATRMLE